MSNVIGFGRRGYDAKLVSFLTELGYEVTAAGTLDGYLDLAIKPRNSSSLTYQLTRDDARQLIAALNAVVQDVTANCLFDRDPRLIDERPATHGGGE